jgi:membrane-associated phospholipid phosphatase
MGFCMLLILAKACEHLLLGITGYHRSSPTLVTPDAVRLSELVTWIKVKDRGSTTFPGDHALVIFSTVGFFWICAGRYLGVIATTLLIPFTLPRLIGGAHWISDILVGALSMALLLLSLSYATPFAARLANAIDRHAGKLLQMAIQLARRLRILR